MSEQELTPENVGELLFGAAPSEPTPDEPKAEAQDTTTADDSDETTTSEDDAGEQAELVRRYGLTSEDAERVRGATWAERCEDAARLAALNRTPSIRERARAYLETPDATNAAEMRLLLGPSSKHERNAALVRAIHGEDEQ